MKKNRNREDSEQFPWKDTLKFAFVLLVVIVAGWFVMMSKLDESSSRGITEIALSEPFYSWVTGFSRIYLIIGAFAVIIWIFAAKSRDERHEWLVWLSVLTAVLLFSIGLMITYMITLIKLNSVHLVYILVGALLFSIIVQTTIAFFKRELLDSLQIASILLFVVLSGVFIWMADHIDGNIIIIFRTSIQDGFWGKYFVWIGGALGAGLFVGIYATFLKRVILREDDDT